jgi:hypothetical protein
MNKRIFWISCCLMGLGLLYNILTWNAGLAASPAEKAVVALKQPSTTQSIFDYFAYINTLSEEELSAEYAQAKDAFSQNNQPLNRLRLALLLGLPQAGFKDYDRSLDLLAEYLDDPNSQDQFFKEFSLFLSAMILKFKEQDQRARNLDVKLKEESEVLQKKLEELKTIEKTIMERGKGQPQ